MKRGDSFENLIELFTKLPGIGPKQAERFAYFIGRSDKRYLDSLINSISSINKTGNSCKLCNIYFSDNERDICSLCSSEERDKVKLMIVSKDQDILAIENSKSFSGLYFIFNKILSVTKEIDEVNLDKMFNTIKNNNTKEIIIAFPTTPDAEHTVFVISNLINKKFPEISVTTPAKGFFKRF